MQTKNCIICGARPIWSYTGHVLKGDEKIIAGSCKSAKCRLQRDSIMIAGGYCGQWRPAYGIEPYKW